MTIEITGPLIVRKNAVGTPDFPHHSQYFEATATVKIRSEICASDLLATLRIANKLFDRFDMTGNLELQARVLLLARGLGVTYKVVHLPTFGSEQQCLSEPLLQELADVAQDAGIVHLMGEKIKAMTNREELCQQKADEVMREAAALGLLVDEYISHSSVSRYLTISTPEKTQVLNVRISDHGYGSGEINVLLRDCIQPVIDAMNATFAENASSPACRGEIGQ
jgi:hypothetical protein